MNIDLTQLKPKESGVIVELSGGHNFISRIQNIGIRPGKKITKISSHFCAVRRCKVDNMQVAIGFR
jgi:Fe2+ transport system protein FeoA